jgi:DNA (cytosine-5)-methyltransferase 1
LGFDAKWGVVSAADVGAPHKRDRIWIVANSSSARRDEGSLQVKRSNGRTFESGSSIEPVKSSGSSAFMAHSTQLQRNGGNDNSGISLGKKSVSKPRDGCGTQIVADSNCAQREGNKRTKRSVTERTFISEFSWWNIEPNVGRVAHGVAARMDRLKAIGNGQVPAVAATAWSLLNDPS